ncbi:MAG: hypothetical protein ACJ8BW_31025 [Ktedonobacteraceae bacterium]|jgi:catechol-2,3-dioxygenase
MPIVTAKRISHIALKTRNVEQQTNFYTNIVGLGETERDNASLRLRGGGFLLPGKAS